MISNPLWNYSYEDLERFYSFSSSFLENFKNKKAEKKDYYLYVNSLSFSSYCQHIIDEYTNMPNSKDYSCQYYYSQSMIYDNIDLFLIHNEDFCNELAIDSLNSFLRYYQNKILNNSFVYKALTPQTFLAKNFSKFAYLELKNKIKGYQRNFRTAERFFKNVERNKFQGFNIPDFYRDVDRPIFTYEDLIKVVTSYDP